MTANPVLQICNIIFQFIFHCLGPADPDPIIEQAEIFAQTRQEQRGGQPISNAPDDAQTLTLMMFLSFFAGRSMSLAMVTHWICNFLVGQVFLSAVSTFGVPTVYVFFAAICFITVAFVAKAVVETKGRSLEEIELASAGV